MLAIAARVHPDPSIKDSSSQWFTLAKSHLDQLILTQAPEPSHAFHYVIIGHVLFGHVVDEIHSFNGTFDHPRDQNKHEQLDTLLVKFRLSIPHPALSVLESTPENRSHAVWLGVLLNTMAILVNYRPITLLDASDDHSTSGCSPAFAMAIQAARDTVRLVKQASTVAMPSLFNVYMGRMLYTAACILIIEWRLTKNPSVREDVEILELLFDRFTDMYS